MTHPLEDVYLPGQISLQETIGSDADGEFFRASHGADSQPVLVKLIAAPSASQPQLAIWQRTVALPHPNLVRLIDCGDTEIDGETFWFAAFEYPDDYLSSALQGGSLSESEVRDVIVAVLDALRYLHSQGFVHGAVDADHIVAIGDRIKLSTDALKESKDRTATTTEDVRQLGELVRHLLAPHRPDASWNEFAEPYRSIIQNTTRHDPNLRWNLAQVAAALEPSEPADPVSVPEPAAPRLEPKKLPRWLYVAYSAIALGAIFFISHNSGTAPRPAAQVAAPASAPAPVVTQTPPVVPPSAPAPRRPVIDQKPRPTDIGPRIWRVIAYTYSSRSLAEKKAQWVNQKWRGFDAGVFAVKGGRGGYLVALGGGRMTHDEALRLQKKAQASGLPRDTYIQNYSE